jgi:hypothetical protein
MFATTVMTVLCAREVSHFVCDSWLRCDKECKPRLIAYWVRLRLGSGEDPIAGPAAAKETSDSRCVRTV